MANVIGIFYVLFAGMAIALLCALVTFAIDILKRSNELKVCASILQNYLHELPLFHTRRDFFDFLHECPRCFSFLNDPFMEVIVSNSCLVLKHNSH